MNQLDKDYLHLISGIVNYGFKKETRNGNVKSTFGIMLTHNMSEGFPLLTTKKMAWKQIVTELLWFLRGDTSIKYLVDNDCHIWNGDCYGNYYKNWDCANKNSFTQKEYLEDGTYGGSSRRFTKGEFIEKIKTDAEFTKTWGDLGPVYGAQWRKWNHKEAWENGFGVHLKEAQIDQIQNLINELRTNPDSRRLLVNSWNVGELENMTLPPCHYSFQLYTRKLSYGEKFDIAVGKRGEWEDNTKNIVNGETFYLAPSAIDHRMEDLTFPKRAISLIWNQRSVDVGLGLPFNIASYGLLLSILGKMTNMIPEKLIGNLGDTHIYEQHIDGLKEQLEREPYDLPSLKISDNVNFKEGINEFLKSCKISDFSIENYQSHPSIKLPLIN